MSYFCDLEKYSSNIAIVTEHSIQLNYMDFLNDSDFIGNHVKKRCLVFIVCKNSLESVVGYIGFMRAGIAIALISNTIAYHMKSSLDWAFASALGAMLLIGVLTVYWIYNKLVGIDNIKLG